MKILVLNVQTLPFPTQGRDKKSYNKRNQKKIKIIRDTILADKPTIIVFTETKHISYGQAQALAIPNYTLTMETHNTDKEHKGGIVVMHRTNSITVDTETIKAATNGLHTICVKFHYKDKNIILGAIYGSHEADRISSSYIDQLSENMDSLTTTGNEIKIIAGDFNVVTDQLDSSALLPANKKLTRMAVKNIEKNHNLTDAAISHEHGRMHTWNRANVSNLDRNKRQTSRLDRILITKNTKSSDYETYNMNTFDHKAISLNIHLEGKTRTAFVTQDNILQSTEYVKKTGTNNQNHLSQQRR